LLIKYIKSVLWRVAKGLSYIEDARCLKVNLLRDPVKGFYQGVIYFQRNDRFHGTRMNVDSFTPIIKVRPYLRFYCEAH
jgi:hypothetical protein